MINLRRIELRRRAAGERWTGGYTSTYSVQFEIASTRKWICCYCFPSSCREEGFDLDWSGRSYFIMMGSNQYCCWLINSQNVFLLCYALSMQQCNTIDEGVDFYYTRALGEWWCRERSWLRGTVLTHSLWGTQESWIQVATAGWLRVETYPERWFPRYCEGTGFKVSKMFVDRAFGEGHVANVKFMPFQKCGSWCVGRTM